jgi:hypothetical protein
MHHWRWHCAALVEGSPHEEPHVHLSLILMLSNLVDNPLLQSKG